MLPDWVGDLNKLNSFNPLYDCRATTLYMQEKKKTRKENKEVSFKSVFLVFRMPFPFMSCSVYIEINGRKCKELSTSPPTASTELSLLKANANCCPTSSNCVSTFLDGLRPNLWSSLSLTSSQSKNLQRENIVINLLSFCLVQVKVEVF